MSRLKSKNRHVPVLRPVWCQKYGLVKYDVKPEDRGRRYVLQLDKFTAFHFEELPTEARLRAMLADESFRRMVELRSHAYQVNRLTEQVHTFGDLLKTTKSPKFIQRARYLPKQDRVVIYRGSPDFEAAFWESVAKE